MVYEDGIFFVHAEADYDYILISFNGKETLAKFVKDGKAVEERKFTGLFWQSNRNKKVFDDIFNSHGYTNFDYQAVIEKFEDYKTYLKEQELKKDEAPSTQETQTIFTSMVNTEYLYEEIIGEDCQPKFIYFNNNHPQFIDKISVGQITYVPIMDDAIVQQAVILPSGINDYESVEKLIEELQLHIRKYLDVSEEYVVFSSYYILLSWVYQALDTIPYLRALGDTGTGKSRFLRVLGGLCYKPIFVAGAITPAPIYRMIKRWGGTIVLDEADFKESNEKNEVITILNCGFSKGTPVMRCEKDNPDNVQILPTFSPKVIATRQSFSDKALESRCLTEIMRQTKRTDLPRILPKAFYHEEDVLRGKLLKFRLEHHNKIDISKISEIDIGKQIEPRLEQATISFAVLFYNIPEVFDKFKRFLFEYQKGMIEERSGSFDGQIVNILLQLIDENVNDITSAMIAERLSEGKIKYSAVTIGRHLKALKIEVKLDRTKSKVGRYIKLNEGEIEDLKRRYSSEYWDSVTDVTNVTALLGDYVSKKVGENDLVLTPKSHPLFEGGESPISLLQPLQVLHDDDGGWKKCMGCGAWKYREPDGCISCGHKETPTKT